MLLAVGLVGFFVCVLPVAGGIGIVAREQARKGNVFVHPMGFRLWYPDGWRLQELQETYQLVPPTSRQTQRGELYFFLGDTADGITRPDEEAVLAYMDRYFESSGINFLSRSGGPRAVESAMGVGALLRWEGIDPSGEAVVANVRTTIARGYVIGLVAFGKQSIVMQRDADLAAIFSAFGLGQGQRDGALVGAWTLHGTAYLENRAGVNFGTESASSMARMASEDTSTLTFSADGRWRRVDERHIIAMGGGTGLEGNTRDEASGTWNAAGNMLYFIWDNRDWQDYRYSIRQEAGRAVLRITAGETVENWVR